MSELNQHQLAQLEQSVSIEQIQLSEKLGAIKATNFIKKLVTVTEIKLIAEIKETKQYKGLKVIDQSGKLVTVTTFEDFCQYLGKSREHIDEDIRNLGMFGEDFLETSQRMGLGYRDLRKLRKIPDADRDVIINGEAVKTEDRESLIDLIEEMSAKHAKEKAERDAKIETLESDKQALESVLKKKDEKVSELHVQVTKLESPPEIAKRQASEADQLRQKAIQLMQQTVLTFLDAVSTFNDEMNAVLDACDDPYVHEQYEANIRMTYQSIATRCNESGLPIDFQQMVTPDWLSEAIEQADASEVYEHQGSEA